jgi:hypothetical protein
VCMIIARYQFRILFCFYLFLPSTASPPFSGMPPSPRRSISETAHPTNSSHSLVPILPNSSNAPVTPNSRRGTSATSSPYPTTRQDLEQARTASRTAERTRRVLADIDWWVVMSGQCDENEDEDEDQSENNFDEEEEWESFQDDGESTVDTTMAPISASENEHNGHLDEEALSEVSLITASRHPLARS